eukprot:366545-Chlamydomonas_euryale.AAC.8
MLSRITERNKSATSVASATTCTQAHMCMHERVAETNAATAPITLNGFPLRQQPTSSVSGSSGSSSTVATMIGFSDCTSITRKRERPLPVTNSRPSGTPANSCTRAAAHGTRPATHGTRPTTCGTRAYSEV